MWGGTVSSGLDLQPSGILFFLHVRAQGYSTCALADIPSHKFEEYPVGSRCLWLRAWRSVEAVSADGLLSVPVSDA